MRPEGEQCQCSSNFILYRSISSPFEQGEYASQAGGSKGTEYLGRYFPPRAFKGFSGGLHGYINILLISLRYLADLLPSAVKSVLLASADTQRLHARVQTLQFLSHRVPNAEKTKHYTKHFLRMVLYALHSLVHMWSASATDGGRHDTWGQWMPRSCH